MDALAQGAEIMRRQRKRNMPTDLYVASEHASGGKRMKMEGLRKLLSQYDQGVKQDEKEKKMSAEDLVKKYHPKGKTRMDKSQLKKMLGEYDAMGALLGEPSEAKGKATAKKPKKGTGKKETVRRWKMCQTAVKDRKDWDQKTKENFSKGRERNCPDQGTYLRCMGNGTPGFVCATKPKKSTAAVKKEKPAAAKKPAAAAKKPAAAVKKEKPTVAAKKPAIDLRDDLDENESFQRDLYMNLSMADLRNNAESLKLKLPATATKTTVLKKIFDHYGLLKVNRSQKPKSVVKKEMKQKVEEI